MVTGTYGDAFAVQGSAHLFGAKTLEDKGEYACFFLRRANHAQPGDAQHTLGRVDQQLMFIAGDIGHADMFEVVDGGAQSDSVSDVTGTCFEAARRRLVRRLLEGDIGNHVATSLPGRSLRQHVRLAVEHADSGRREDLVAGEDIEIAIERLDIDGHMRNRLRAVE